MREIPISYRRIMMNSEMRLLRTPPVIVPLRSPLSDVTSSLKDSTGCRPGPL